VCGSQIFRDLNHSLREGPGISHHSGRRTYIPRASCTLFTEGHCVSSCIDLRPWKWRGARSSILRVSSRLRKLQFRETSNSSLNLKDKTAYYLADHANCTQFWVENSDTERLDLPTVTSTSQLSISPVHLSTNLC
jgi:hypothetical protein